MSPIRGDVKKNSSPFLSEGRWLLWLASSPISILERLWARCVFQTDQASWHFLLDGFMTRWWFDAFGSGSCASKRVGQSGPTMVLSETRGLQLFWVMRGGIG
jgi:hypothetical protein